MIDKDKQPGIAFHEIILVKDKFERSPRIPEELNVNMEFEFSSNTIEEKHVVEIKTVFTCTTNDNIEHLRLECVHIGFFSIINGQENMNITEFIQKNSAALMFPFIREHIHSITQKSGVGPIAIPPINIIALIKKQSNKSE